MNESIWDVGDLAGERKEKTEEHKEMTIREKVLEEAKKAVCRDRNNQYGEPENNFGVIAKLWESYLEARCVSPGADVGLGAREVAEMMVLFKVGRCATVPPNADPKADNYIDIAGYAACAAECIFKEEKNT